MALDSDGHLFIAGSTTAASSDLLVVRLVAATGTLDAAFGTGGVFSFNSGRGSSEDVGNGVAIGQDGSVYVAGASVGTATTRKMALWKLTHAGALEPSFGGTGDSTVPGLMLPPHAAGGTVDRGLALAVDGSAVVVVGESGSTTGFFDLAIWRVR